MRALVASLFFLMSSQLVFGKDNSYTGWINMNGRKIKFSIQFNIAKNNLITGTSLTAHGTSDETKCKIRGKYNRRNGEIHFYETVVIKSKAKYENLNFCLLSARVKRKVTKNEVQYSGNFSGHIRGTKKKCASGKIYFSKIKRIKKELIKPTVKKNNKTVKVKEKDILYSHISSKKLTEYKIIGGTLELSIWDDANADGDRVNVYFNGKKVISNFELTNSKKTIKLTIPEDEKIFTIKIEALNEGQATPNTSQITLKNKNFSKSLRAHIKKNEFVYIKLFR